MRSYKERKAEENMCKQRKDNIRSYKEANVTAN